MSTVTTGIGRLTLYPLSSGADGDVIAPLELHPEREPNVTIGRGSKAGWHIPDRRISRRHAALNFREGAWWLCDTGSQHGTRVNGVQVDGVLGQQIKPGDEIAFGPWRCQCERSGGQVPVKPVGMLYEDIATVSSRVTVMRRSDLAGVSQQRLEAVLLASRKLASATSRDEVARVLRESVSEVTENARIFVVRPIGEQRVEFLGLSSGVTPPDISQSLVRAVLKTRLAQTLGDLPGSGSTSLLRLDIRSAICAPLIVANRVDSLLYLDSRGGERPLPGDVLSFCVALADVGGLAIERLVAMEHAAIRAQLDRDLKAAHAAQAMLLPPREGSFDGLRYVFESIPGRYVAGDLFDVVPLPGGRIAFSLGDVSGKGMGAGILMAATQMQFRALLTHGVSLSEAIKATNRCLNRCTEDNKFVTLVAGLWDPGRGELMMSDAGHGCVLVREPDGDFAPVKVDGGLPLGVAPDAEYPTTILRPVSGTRIVLFSDGITEQANDAGDQFGTERAMRALQETAGPAQDVTTLIGGVIEHASNGRIDDDLTVASIELG